MGQFDAVMSNPASRRTFLKGVGVLGASGVLAACRKNVQSTAAAGPSTSIGPIESEPGLLHVFEWAGYDAKWLYPSYLKADYEQPKFSFLVNTEGALARTAAGFEWDITHPEAGYIQDYINMGAIQPWDTSLIPNFAKLNPVLEQTGVVDGKQYEIGLDWGYSGVILRTDKLDPSIDSYSYLFDDAGAGHISWFDTPWILQQAGLVLGVDPNQTFDMTPDQLDQCKNYCIEKGKNLYNIWTSYSDMWDDVAKANVWLRTPGPTRMSISKTRCRCSTSGRRRARSLGSRVSSCGPARRITTTRMRSPTLGPPRESARR